MPKALALVVVAALVAVGAGLALPANAIKVNGATVTLSELNDELNAIGNSASYTCYLSAKSIVERNTQAPKLAGVEHATWSNAATVGWSDQRVTQLSLIGYVSAHNPAAFTTAALTAARSSLESSIDQTQIDAHSSSSSFSCPGAATGSVTLASMPTWFVDEQVQAQAAILGLAALAPKVPESGPALETWFNQHASEFDTMCISAIVVNDAATAEVVVSKIKGGMSLAEAARRYSVDPTSKAKGGSIGCYGPNSPSWEAALKYVGQVPVGSVAVYPVQSSSGTTYYQLLGPTSRTPNAYKDISASVAKTAKALNLQASQLLASEIQSSSKVTVSPSVGTWQPTASGGAIAQPATPPAAAVTNPAANTPAP